MNKERRLGRGLEALLGGLPGWSGMGAKPGEGAPLAAMPEVGAPGTQPAAPADDPYAPLGGGGAAGSAAGGGRRPCRTRRPRPADCRGWRSIRSPAIPCSPGRTSTPRSCRPSPRASPPTACSSRWSCGRSAIATSWSPASGVCRRPSAPAGTTCRSASSRPTTGRRPNWPSSKTCIARTSTPWRRRPRSSVTFSSTAAPRRSWPAG